MQRSLIIVLLSWMPLILNAASFDCAKAKSIQEKLICSNPDLSNADSDLAGIYKKALSVSADKDALKKSQLQWIKTRDVCVDINCMLLTYRNRIRELESLSNKVSAQKSEDSKGRYPVWVSPDLGVKSLSPKDIDAALNRKFWDNLNYVHDYPNEIFYLKENQNKKDMPVSCVRMYQLFDERKMYKDGRMWLSPSKNSLSNKLEMQIESFLDNAETDCQAIKMLKIIKAAHISHVRNFSLKEHFENYLPIITEPYTSRSYSKEYLGKYKEMPWSEFWKVKGPDKKQLYSIEKAYTSNQISSFTLTVSRVDKPKLISKQNYEIRILAFGDFNQSENEQILIKVKQIDIPADHYTALYLLTRAQPDAKLLALYPDYYFLGKGYGAAYYSYDYKFYFLTSEG